MSKRTFKRVPDLQQNMVEVTGKDQDNPPIPSADSSTRKQKSEHQYLLNEINRRLKKHSEALVSDKQYDDKNPFNSPRKLPIPPQEDLKLEIKSDRSDNTEKMTSCLPVSSSRQKRRSALTKRQGGRTLSGLQPVLIQKYRPDYTWNRGGRVKELRIRTVGRKFLYIWISKVYGRVNPLVARTHFNQKLLKHAWREWREVWWTNVKEWRLTVRAECQYRYVLWNRVFRAWKLFVIKNKARQYHFSIADKHADGRILKRSLAAWKEYHNRRKEKVAKKMYAQTFRQENILRKAWTCWTDHFVLKQQHKQMEDVSLHFWAYRIQIQYCYITKGDNLPLQFWAYRIKIQHWLQWRHQCEERVTERIRLNRAQQLYEKSLKAKCFNSLMAYTNVRKFKKNRKEFAEKIFASNLMERIFIQWKDSWRMKRSLAEHQHNIVRLARTCAMRKAFVQWKLYISQKHRERERREMADVYYLKHLLNLVFNGLRLGVVQRKIKITRNQLAQDFHDTQRLQQTWNVWLKRSEENEELELLPLSKTARDHYRHVSLQKYWVALVQYKRRRQTKQEKYLKAEAYFYWKSLPKYFFRMKVFVHIMKKNQEDAEKAVHFRRENVQARFFYHWFVESKNSQDDRMAERMAILHNDEKVTRRFLSVWKKRTQEAVEYHEKEVVAKEHFSRCCCKRAVREWRNFVREMKVRRNNDTKAAHHHYVQKMKQAWKGLKMYHKKRQEKKEKLDKALSHFTKKEYRLVMSHWKLDLQQQQQQKAKAEKMFHQKCILVQRLAFQTWRNNAQEIVNEKKSGHRAEVYHHSYILAKVFQTWHRFAAIHAYKKSETKLLVEDGRQAVEKGIIKRVFVKWRETRDQSLMSRLKYEQAVQHHDNNTKMNTIQVWKTFVKVSQRKKLLNRQAEWFRQTVLQSHCILCWKYEYTLALEYQSKTNLALWHWSLSLQRNVLVNWWNYCQSRKQKKSRLGEALERRRSRLLKGGVTQWIKVAQEFTQMRAQFAAQKHTKSAYESFQLVQKYALHWKQMTAKRKDIRDKCSGDGHVVSKLPLESRLKTPFIPVICRSPLIPSRSKVPIERPSALESDKHLPQPMRTARARPRRPDFLIASLKRDGLLSSSLEPMVPLRSVHGENPPLQDKSHQKTTDVITDKHSDQIEDNTMPQSLVDLEHLDHSNSYNQNNYQVILETRPKEQPHMVPNNMAPTSSKEAQIHIQNSLTFSQPNIFGIGLERSAGYVEENSKISNKTVPILHPELLPSGNHVISEKIMTSNKQISNPNTTTTLKLLTPSTFLTRKDGTPIVNGENPNISKKKVDSHGLSGTRTEIPIADRLDLDSCSSTPRYDFQFVSTVKTDSLTAQTEIVQIRDRLKLFDAKKKKLKELKSQWKHLNSCLGDPSVSDDDDAHGIREELAQINEEMASLRSEISQEKPVCSELVKRVQHLIQQQQY